MFGLIADWYRGKLFKKDFLANKNINQGKFDYWLKKYLSSKLDLTDTSPLMTGDHFKEITIPTVKKAESESSLSIKIWNYTPH